MQDKIELGVAKKTTKTIRRVKKFSNGKFNKMKSRRITIYGGSDTCQVQIDTGKPLTL